MTIEEKYQRWLVEKRAAEAAEIPTLPASDTRGLHIPAPVAPPKPRVQHKWYHGIDYSGCSPGARQLDERRRRNDAICVLIIIGVVICILHAAARY